MANSKRRCGACKSYFRPEQTFPGTVSWCSPECGLIVAQKRVPAVKRKEAAQERAQTKEARERIRTLSEWVSLAQEDVNRVVVLEDRYKGCISCKTGRVSDAGHYFHRGSKYRCSPLTLDRRNLNGQCNHCNTYQGGKQHDYQIGYIARYGQAQFDGLCEYKMAVDRGEIPPLTVEECKAAIASAKARLKALRQSE